MSFSPQVCISPLDISGQTGLIMPKHVYENRAGRYETFPYGYLETYYRAYNQEIPKSVLFRIGHWGYWTEPYTGLRIPQITAQTGNFDPAEYPPDDWDLACASIAQYASDVTRFIMYHYFNKPGEYKVVLPPSIIGVPTP